MNKTALKIFCLVVSLFIWIQVAATHKTMRDISIPLELTGLNVGLTLAGSQWPDVISVRATGSKLDFFLNRYFGRNLGFASVDVSHLVSGTNVQQQVSFTDITSPLSELTIVPPVWLNLIPDTVDSVEVRVEAEFTGLLNSNIMFVDEPTVEPEFVTLVGPSRLMVDGLFVPTEPIDLARLNSSGPITRRLKIPFKELQCNIDVAVISVEISTLGQKTFNHIPIVALKDANYGNVIVTPPVVDIVIEGPVDLLAGLDPDEISVLISLTGLEPGTHDLQAQVQLPDNFRMVSMEPEQFNVVIGANQAQE